MKPSLADREHLVAALQSVRNAMVASQAGAPTLPPLLSAEENLLRALFDAAEVEEYLASFGAKVYGR
jgi:hypothetical protein